MTMQKSFPEITFTGVGASAFDRLGPEEYFPNYTILSLKPIEWFSHFPELQKRVRLINDLANDPVKITTTKAALEYDGWAKIKANHGIANLLTYKPLPSQQEFQDKNSIRVLANSYELFKQFENKTRFREIVTGLVNLPSFELLEFAQLEKHGFEEFEVEYGDFVIQDSSLSGGRGTFIVKSVEDFKRALDILKDAGSETVVLSEYIEGRSASVQVCVTKYGVFSLPPQRQIIDQPELVDGSAVGADKFNGGQWSADDFSENERYSIRKQAEAIGNKMSELGYKGIFGIDFIAADDEVFIIEVNARLTGMTPVIASLQNSLGQFPLLVLHILELMNGSYELSEDEIAEIQNYAFGEQNYSYLVLFNTTKVALTINNTLKPGIYTREENGDIRFDRLAYQVKDILKDNEFLLIDFPAAGEQIKANKRIGRVITRTRALAQNDLLTDESKSLVHSIRSAL